MCCYTPNAVVAFFLCFIGQTDVIKQDIVLPVFVMAVDALTPAMSHRRLYWKAVIEGVQGRGGPTHSTGRVGWLLR
jgi:hypothetical protein